MYSIFVFYIISTIIVLFALLTLKFENIFYSLLSAMVVFLGAAVLFFISGSEYNAVIQFAVYGFAVPIILGLAVMFTTLKEKHISKSNKSYLLFLICGIFTLAIIYLTMISQVIVPEGFNVTGASSVGLYQVKTLSEILFIKYVWAFELISIVLTIAATGLTLFKKEVKQ